MIIAQKTLISFRTNTKKTAEAENEIRVAFDLNFGFLVVTFTNKKPEETTKKKGEKHFFAICRVTGRDILQY
jgi:hypothetical protein